MLTDAEIRAKLSDQSIALGSRAKAADTYGISPSYFTALVVGHKPFTSEILMRLGFPEEAQAKVSESKSKREAYIERSKKAQSGRHKTAYRYCHRIEKNPAGQPIPKPLLARSGSDADNGNDDGNGNGYDNGSVNGETADNYDINKIRYSYNRPPLTPEEMEEQKKEFSRRSKRDILSIERNNHNYGKLAYAKLVKEGKAGIIDEQKQREFTSLFNMSMENQS